mgnify:CR=1 FL=1|jgi:nucleoid-associated protein YgaU
MKNRSSYLQPHKNKKNGKISYRSISYPEIPNHTNDVYITTTIGDRLDSLAHNFYKDQRLWWIIAAANRDIIRKDSYALKSGLRIRIPANIRPILKNFENLNK